MSFTRTLLEGWRTGRAMKFDRNDTLSRAMKARGRRDDATALVLFRRLHRSEPNNATFCYFLGDSLRRLGRYVEGEALLLSAFQNKLTHKGYIAICLAELYEYLGRFTEAEQWYRQATIEQPTEVPCWQNYGNFLYKQGKAAEAIEIHQSALNADGDIDEVYVNIGLCFRSLEDYPSARSACIKALFIDPNNEDARDLLADLDQVIAEITSDDGDSAI